jgi:germination protein M
VKLAYKKILSMALVFSMVLGMTGCGTLEMMANLKSNGEEEVADVSGLTEFEIVEDDLSGEPAVETITVDADTKMKEIIAYYEDDNGYVVPVNTEIPFEEGIAKATLRSLVVGSDVEKRIAQSGLHGVLPEGTEILGMSIKDGLARIDFSKNILNTASVEQEENMISALTYTLTEFATINKVQVLVEGQALASLSKGFAIDTAFERKNINLYGKEAGVNYTVYYKAPDTEVAGHYVPVTFSAEKVNNPAVAVIEKLFTGAPKDTQLSNKIPYGVNLKNVEIAGDTAVLDLGIGAVNLTEQEYTDMHKIVVLCLQQFKDIANVDYKIDGLTFEEAGLNFEDEGIVPAFNEY